MTVVCACHVVRARSVTPTSHSEIKRPPTRSGSRPNSASNCMFHCFQLCLLMIVFTFICVQCLARIITVQSVLCLLSLEYFICFWSIVHKLTSVTNTSCTTLSYNWEHLNCAVCVEIKKEDIRTVLCCIV